MSTSARPCCISRTDVASEDVESSEEVGVLLLAYGGGGICIDRWPLITMQRRLSIHKTLKHNLSQKPPSTSLWRLSSLFLKTSFLVTAKGLCGSKGLRLSWLGSTMSHPPLGEAPLGVLPQRQESEEEDASESDDDEDAFVSQDSYASA